VLHAARAILAVKESPKTKSNRFFIIIFSPKGRLKHQKKTKSSSTNNIRIKNSFNGQEGGA